MLIFSADKFFKIPIYFIEKTNGLKYIKYAHHCFLFIIFTFSISVSFAERALEEEGVVVLPGAGLGSGGEGFFRIALTVGNDLMKTAAKRLGRLIET